jgi:RecA/RadA recombinase
MLGNRNNELASYAGKAYANGLTPQEFIPEAIRWGSNCQPPMDLNEIHSVVSSMWQTHKRNNPLSLIKPNRPTKFLRSAEELKNDPPLEWTVRGVLPNNGIGAIYGAPSSGKTFLALDLAFAIAAGKPWFGNPTIQKPVAYVALEGSHGIRQRMIAWEKSNLSTTPKNLNFVTAPVNVDDGLAWQALSKEIVNTLGTGAIVFVDTLNRASPTAEENTSASMGKIIESGTYMADVVNGFVMFIHHAGKDAAKGLRGHSSLLAALDTVIKVSTNSNQRMWSIEKSKDSEIGICNAFELKTIELGSKDFWGIAHTSCTVSQGILKPVSKPIKGKNQQQVMSVLTDILFDESTDVITQTDLEIKVAKNLDIGDPKRAKERAKSSIASLIDSGHLLLTNGGITLN